MVFEPDVTIITPIFVSGEDKSLLKIANIIKKQRYSGKITHIFINDNPANPKKIKGLRIIPNRKNLGLTTTLRNGMKMAKTEIIVTLFDDCLPSSTNWLKNLVAPLEREDVVASASKVEMPEKFWKTFDFWARALTAKEQRVLTTALDQKGCAYKKWALEKVDFVDDKKFRLGGDDADLYIKMKKIGKVVSTSAKVYHLHWYNARRRIKKEVQYGEFAAGSIKKNYWNFPLKWKIVFIVPHLMLLVWILSIFFTLKIFLFTSILLFILANRDYPVQLKKLWGDARLIVLPFFNLFIYFAWIYAFWKTWIVGKRA